MRGLGGISHTIGSSARVAVDWISWDIDGISPLEDKMVLGNTGRTSAFTPGMKNTTEASTRFGVFPGVVFVAHRIVG